VVPFLWGGVGFSQLILFIQQPPPRLRGRQETWPPIAALVSGTAVSRAYRYREIAVLPWGPAARHGPIDPVASDGVISFFIYLSFVVTGSMPGDARWFQPSGTGGPQVFGGQWEWVRSEKQLQCCVDGWLRAGSWM